MSCPAISTIKETSLPIPLQNGGVDARTADIVKKCFADLAAGIACGAVVSCFVATSGALTIIALMTGIQVIVSVACRFLFSEETGFVQYFSPALFATGTFVRFDTLVHEVGHAATASLLFEGAHPTIEISAFGGVTKYFNSAVTDLGAKVGAKNANLLVAAAGPMLSVAVSLSYLAGSHYTRESHPELSRYLLCMCISNIFQHIIYALSTFIPACVTPGHDFAYLYAVGGIHPLVAVVTLIALPILVQLGLNYT